MPPDFPTEYLYLWTVTRPITDISEQVVDDWDAAEDSDAEREKAKVTEEAKKKAEAEALLNKKSKAQRVEEHRMANMRRKQEEIDDVSEEEDEREKVLRQRALEKEMDEKNAADLFSGVGTKTKKEAARTVLADESDPTSAIDLGSLKLFNPSTRDQFQTLRETLAPLMNANAKKAQYTTFLSEFNKEIAKDLPSDQIKKVASALTTLSNEKMKEEKLAEKGGKKTKAAKTKTTLNAARNPTTRADTNAYDDDGLAE